MKRYAIIVAGGSGLRFGSPVPKQFLELAGKPILMHTINKFLRAGDIRVVLVLSPDLFDYWQELCHKHEFVASHIVIAGGDSRFQSVKNALKFLSFAHNDLVAVHDGVRPLVSSSLINRTFEAAARLGAVIPAVPVTDSVRQVEGDASQALLRSTLRAVQTPQTFNALALQKAYCTPFNHDFTDDASVFEQAGGRVHLVEGELFNIKITHPLDIKFAENILSSLHHE